MSLKTGIKQYNLKKYILETRNITAETLFVYFFMFFIIFVTFAFIYFSKI